MLILIVSLDRVRAQATLKQTIEMIGSELALANYEPYRNKRDWQRNKWSLYSFADCSITLQQVFVIHTEEERTRPDYRSEEMSTTLCNFTLDGLHVDSSLSSPPTLFLSKSNDEIRVQIHRVKVWQIPSKNVRETKEADDCKKTYRVAIDFGNPQENNTEVVPRLVRAFQSAIRLCEVR